MLAERHRGAWIAKESGYSSQQRRPGAEKEVAARQPAVEGHHGVDLDA